MDNIEFKGLIDELKTTYGQKPVFQNLEKNYRNGWIIDPHLPALNSAVLLKAVWSEIQKRRDKSLVSHFGVTLDDIAQTCLQGVSHRLFYDYIIIVDQKTTTYGRPWDKIYFSYSKS